MEESSETNLVIITRRHRFVQFCRIYWRTLVVLIAPLVLLPVAFIGENNAYISFYVFAVTAVYWALDVLHPTMIAIMPIGISCILGGFNKSFISEMYIRKDLLDCIAVMMMIIAIEHSNVHRRIALKVLLVFGCSHYRLSFLLFFTSMFLSMWLSSVLTCGLMMPVLKAILTELEKMGILEIYQTIGKAKQMSTRHEQSVPRPSDFTLFYFLGIAYSSSIGDMATMMGCQTNQIFKIYSESIFPMGPKIEFPHFMLLNLPGVLVMETLLYFWMNFNFLGMFRGRHDIEVAMTEEEAQYIDTLLATQYKQMGKYRFHEFVIGAIVIVTAFLEAALSTAYIDQTMPRTGEFHSHLRVSSPCIISVVLLFLFPINSKFTRFFYQGSESSEQPLPRSQSKACLNWRLVRDNIDWSIPVILAGSSTLVESMRDAGMTREMETFLISFQNWPKSAVVFIVVVFCKILTEFASNISVVYGVLPSIAKVSVICDINPHYLMMAATLASSLPFHLMIGTPVNAMVCAYVHIPPWKMMYAGIGPSLISVVVVWFTVAIWSTAVWTDITLNPEWAVVNIFRIFKKTV